MTARLLPKFLIPLIGALAIGAADGASAGTDVIVEEVTDFTRVADTSNKKHLPILLMFSAEYCSFCVSVEEDFLKPMLRSGDYEDKVLIRKMKISGYSTVRDFDGKRVSSDEFADRYGVIVTPTVVFLDDSGGQLAPKRVGLTTPDFYGGYLDQSIDIALDVLRRNKPLRVRPWQSE